MLSVVEKQDLQPQLALLSLSVAAVMASEHWEAETRYEHILNKF